jgi:putative Holliday junction resolvase
MSVQDSNVSKQSLNNGNMTKAEKAKVEFPILALDYGSKRVGLAVSDNRGVIATPLDVLKITDGKSHKTIVPRLQEYIVSYRIKTILVGMPQAFTSSQTRTQENIQRFINMVAKEVTIPIITTDESFSTAEAQNMLLSTGQHVKATRNKIDMVAATVFLQEFLNSITH